MQLSNVFNMLRLWEQESFKSTYKPNAGEPQRLTDVVHRIEKVVRAKNEWPENYIVTRKMGTEAWTISSPMRSNLPLSERYELVYYPQKDSWAIMWAGGGLEVIDGKTLIRVIKGWITGF